MSSECLDLQWNLNKITQYQLLTFQNQHEHQNNHQSLRFQQHLQTNLNIEQGKKHNEQASDFSKKILYVGNLSPVATGEDLCELFCFKTTNYLQKNM